MVIGDRSFHMFMAPARGEGALRKIPGTDKDFPERVDAFILRSVVDNGRFVYGDMGPMSQHLSGELDVFITQVAEVIECLRSHANVSPPRT